MSTTKVANAEKADNNFTSKKDNGTFKAYNSLSQWANRVPSSGTPSNRALQVPSNHGNAVVVGAEVANGSLPKAGKSENKNQKSVDSNNKDNTKEIIHKALEMSIDDALVYLKDKEENLFIHRIYIPISTDDAIDFLKACYEDKSSYNNVDSILNTLQYLKREGIGNEGRISDLWRATTIDSKGYNMIANMERNLSTINYDKKTGLITSIPTTSTDVGYGHDYIQNPLPSVPTSVTASEAYELLKKDLNGIGPDGKYEKHKDYIKAIAGIDAKFTQDQFNALIGLRYNVGSLGAIDGLLEYLENGVYERNELKNIINSYYDAIIKKDPSKEKYRKGWYKRTEDMLNIFFGGDYGDMPIDAVNGKVISK